MVSFLASDKAKMITGQSMIVDGGKFGASMICRGKLLTKCLRYRLLMSVRDVYVKQCISCCCFRDSAFLTIALL